MAVPGGLLPQGYETLEDANGTTVPGGLIWTYAAGTTTPLATYADNLLTIPNTNPIIADGSGRWTAYAAFGTGYKFVFETPAVPPAHGATIKTCDNIVAPLTELTSVDTGGATVVSDSTATGAVNNYVLVGRMKETFWQWGGAAELFLTGIAGGVAGQRLTIKNISALGTQRRITFAHGSASSAAINQFYNAVTLCPTPIGPMGWATYIHNGAGWILTEHNQGSWITRPFSSANYGAANGTWIPTAAARDAYYLIGRTLHYAFNVSGPNSLSTSSLLIVIPHGFTAVSANADIVLSYFSVAGVVEPGTVYAGGTTIAQIRTNGTNIPAGTQNIAGQLIFEVQ